MTKMTHSLVTKLTLSFVLLIVVIAGLAFVTTYNATQKALKEQMGCELRSTAAAAASLIDGGQHAGLRAGDEQKPQYLDIQKQIQKIRANNPNIKYIYTMRRAGDGVEFVIDADYGAEEDAASIGEAYEQGPNYKELMDGFERNSADKEFTTDQWGVVLSGYSPIRDSLGNSVGLLGVDMDSKEVIARQQFIQNTIYYIIGIAILLAGIIVLLFSQTIIRDINKLNRTANNISLGQMDAVVDVKRRDEIGELAESFSRMQASLKIMMNQDENPNESEK
ncbi:MAG: HAMP domain-containing protein [bacterium]|nr:HAMP domain-containing protein [bacterium]